MKRYTIVSLTYFIVAILYVCNQVRIVFLDVIDAMLEIISRDTFSDGEILGNASTM